MEIGSVILGAVGVIVLYYLLGWDKNTPDIVGTVSSFFVSIWDYIKKFFSDFGSDDMIATVVVIAIVGILGSSLSSASGGGANIKNIGVMALLLLGVYLIYQGISGDKTKSDNLVGTPTTTPQACGDASKGGSGTGGSAVVVPAAKAPTQNGANGGNYGIQWWMYVQDWDYNFGKKKPVIRRGVDNKVNPYVFLNEVDNTLTVRLNVFPKDSSSSGSDPAPTGSTGSATDDIFDCSVPNIPLQKWFAVSLSVSGRNIDIYIDGLLVRSCLASSVPRTSNANIEVMPDGGFSGSVVDMFHFSRALVPADAQLFASKGTSAKSANWLPSKSLFGYNIKFGILDSAGKEIKKYVF
jgi:hypothetical protein